MEFYILGELTSQKFLLSEAESENHAPEFSRFSGIMQDYNKKLVLVESFYQKSGSASSGLDVLLGVQRPAGLYFSKFSLQSEPKLSRIKAVVSGFSNTRDNLLVFKNNLEAASKIENINFSPEAWLSQKNINFNLTFDIIDGK